MQEQQQTLPNRFKALRERLGLTQDQMAQVLGCTQGNIGHYELRGQSVPPAVAQRLIFECAIRGTQITYDDIYEPASVLWAKAQVQRHMLRTEIQEGENK